MYDTPLRANSRTGRRPSSNGGAPPPLSMPPVLPAPSPNSQMGKPTVASGIGINIGPSSSHNQHISSKPSSRDLMSSPVNGPPSPSMVSTPQTPQQRMMLRKPSVQQLSTMRSSTRLNMTPRASAGEVYKGKIHVGVRAKPSKVSPGMVLEPEGGRIEHDSAGLFKFDKVYTGENSNSDVFSDSVGPLIQQVCDGYNATVFAYGTTGSGKTYTMQGVQNDPGVITRSVTALFNQLLASGAPHQVKLSYFEIYNERVFDLLSPESQKPDEVQLRDSFNGDTQVVGQREVVANSAAELLNYVASGDQLRRTSSTQYNEHSSRSHAVVRIQVLTNDNQSILYLCDLAGSEKATMHGERRKEGSYINKSLLTLSSVISLLSKGGGFHVPYRDSKLTRLLQPSLSGSALVSMLCTIHTTPGNAETVNSLRFAAKAKDIAVTAKRNSVFDDLSGFGASSGLARLVEQLQAENNALRTDFEKIRIERDDLRDRLEIYEAAENSDADASIEAMVGIGESGSNDTRDVGRDQPSTLSVSAESESKLQKQLDRYILENDQLKEEKDKLNKRVTRLAEEIAALDANLAHLETEHHTDSSRSITSSTATTPTLNQSEDGIRISSDQFNAYNSKDDEIAELKEQLKDKEMVIACMTSISEAQHKASIWKTDESVKNTTQGVEDLRI